MKRRIAALIIGGAVGTFVALTIVSLAAGEDDHPFCPGWPAGTEPQAMASSVSFDPVTGEMTEPFVTCLQRITVGIAADGY